MTALGWARRRAVRTASRLSAQRRERLAIDLVATLGDDLRFEQWEQAGFHLTPVHFYSPIPDTREIPERAFTELSALPGIDMREDEQVRLLERMWKAHGREYNALPREFDGDRFFIHNGAFSPTDSEMLYAMLRTFKPKRFIEVGSGWSTLCAALALAANAEEGAAGEITAFDPYAFPFLRRAAERDDRIHLETTKIQDVPVDVFGDLVAGDMLFIDSSHVGSIGSDVTYEYLEILPRLRPGVIVHIHDIFLPAEYPSSWVLKDHRFWNEQYILQAFLAFNRGYEVLLGGSYLHKRRPEILEKYFDTYDRVQSWPCSFWMRRV